VESANVKTHLIRSLAAFALFGACALPVIAAPHMGDPLPEFSIPADKSGTIDSKKLLGKAVYVNFFASWCPPCNDEAPNVKKLYGKYQKRGFVVIGIDEAEGASSALAFAKKYGWTFPVGQDTDGKVLDPYRSPGLPVHIFVDRKGKISLVRFGIMESDEVEDQIKKII
jgi:peroxiredoxin